MKKIMVRIAQLTPAHRAAILEAAERQGYAVVFCESKAQSLAEAADAEIIFAGNPALLKAAPRLKWMCVPSAGVEPHLSPEIYASPEAILTNSSGAYGVTIAEHIVMVALELMRRGDITGMSFAFDDDYEDSENGVSLERTNETVNGKEVWIRHVKRITGLYDVSIVTHPAYEQTSVATRE